MTWRRQLLGAVGSLPAGLATTIRLGYSAYRPVWDAPAKLAFDLSDGRDRL
jgi:hypothetical protein